MFMLLVSKNNSKILVFSFNEYLVIIIIQTNFLMYPSYFKIINLIKPNQLQDKEN